jgi:hypothetical protein
MKTHSDLVEELCLIRKNWKREDFVEAYGDEWIPVPRNLSDCHQMMETHIYNSYDTDYIKEVIENEEYYAKAKAIKSF